MRACDPFDSAPGIHPTRADLSMLPGHDSLAGSFDHNRANQPPTSSQIGSNSVQRSARRQPKLRYVAVVSDYVIPEPEPKPIDEKLSIELRHLADNAVLKGNPSGDEKCENCRFYLEPYKEISYCWHQKLRILVGAKWWCQWWDPIPEDQQ